MKESVKKLFDEISDESEKSIHQEKMVKIQAILSEKMDFISKMKLVLSQKKEECIKDKQKMLERENNGFYGNLWSEADRCRNGKSGDGFRIRNPDAEVTDQKEKDMRHIASLDNKLLDIEELEKMLFIGE